MFTCSAGATFKAALECCAMLIVAILLRLCGLVNIEQCSCTDIHNIYQYS